MDLPPRLASQHQVKLQSILASRIYVKLFFVEKQVQVVVDQVGLNKLPPVKAKSAQHTPLKKPSRTAIGRTNHFLFCSKCCGGAFTHAFLHFLSLLVKSFLHYERVFYELSVPFLTHLCHPPWSHIKCKATALAKAYSCPLGAHTTTICSLHSPSCKKILNLKVKRRTVSTKKKGNNNN